MRALNFRTTNNYCLHKKIYFTALLLFFLFAFAQLKAQTVTYNTDSVSAIFTSFITQKNKCNIVLVTSRDIFITGEKIWFKAYAVNANDGKLNFENKNLFADIVNDKDSVLQQVVLNNNELHTNGAFDIPDSVATGFYWLRCYTASQVNNGGDGISIHPVYILNKNFHDESAYAKKYISDIKKEKFSADINFYPERLTAIPGIISTGVIEIKDQDNIPVAANGELLNSKDSVITNFNTNNLGLARLTFLNEPSEKYTAVFYLNGNTLKYQLPAANKSAAQLSVANQSSKSVKAFVTLEEFVPENMHTTILAVQNDSLYYAAVGNGNFGITIPTENFPGGIVRLLLFNDDKQLLCERKIYIAKNNINLEVKAEKKKYGQRENASVNIKVADYNNKPLTTVLNVSVEDESVIQLTDSLQANAPIPSSTFLLNEWLNRYHEKYSNNDIDLLLLTKSSLGTSNENASTNNTNNYDDNDKLLNLSGKIVDRKGKGISQRIVTIVARNSTQGFYMDADTTDNNGAFNFPVPQAFDSLKFSLQVTTKNNIPLADERIVIDSFHYPLFTTPASIKKQFLAANLNALSVFRKYNIDTTTTFQGKGWLAPVTVTTIKKQEPNYDESRRITAISQILTSDKFRYGGADAIYNALLMVPGVSLAGGDISIFGPSFDFQGHIGRPLVVMDGFAWPTGTSVKAVLDGLNPADIDFIEVLRGAEAGIFGVRGGNGVISINTKHGPDKIDYSHSNFKTFTPFTYHVNPVFAMPDYSNTTTKNSTVPDARTTIFWNANLFTNKNGEATFNFYTADAPANYAITVTGLTANGQFIYKRITITNTGKSR